MLAEVFGCEDVGVDAPDDVVEDAGTERHQVLYYCD